MKNFCGADAAATNTKILYVQSKQKVSIFELVKIFSSYGHAEVEMNSNYSAFVTVETQSRYTLGGIILKMSRQN